MGAAGMVKALWIARKARKSGRIPAVKRVLRASLSGFQTSQSTGLWERVSGLRERLHGITGTRIAVLQERFHGILGTGRSSRLMHLSRVATGAVAR